ncbi:PBECR4 domain-containing protein [Heyndrickxia sporothermodurans]|uniref:PBECR4 domain-containing protein n=1 Tax=Heyndrickxia sporothermodurans TaxID=46224 RepID=UPI002DBF678C|nr:PBECR4 domain-containing protein [Heyndrickxia sporothermodurans]MEB6551135.1 PBECR4 domain-containing protein [Heyndrickxia sporothermodurans]
MLSVTDLLTVQTMPSVTDVSLQTIQLFYKEHLCDRVFIFELDDKDRPIVKLRFSEKHLCHLLGIQYVLTPQMHGYKYLGSTGYTFIEDGTVTFDFLKTENKIGFKSKKRRMLYFPFVYQILKNPTTIIFNKSLVSTMIDVDIILYNQLNNTYLHLGIDKDADSDFYYPKSFYDRKKDDHISGQTQVLVKAMRVEID